MKNDSSHAVLLEAQELGHEARADTSDHAALRLWLRMLSCTTQIETEIRRRLRGRFGVSLARFDYLAQLYRSEDGLKMRELARRLMVTGGNVTGLTDDLERAGLVARESGPNDRRSWIVRLTPEGRRAFKAMAAEHRAMGRRAPGLPWTTRRCSRCTRSWDGCGCICWINPLRRSDE